MTNDPPMTHQGPRGRHSGVVPQATSPSSFGLRVWSFLGHWWVIGGSFVIPYPVTNPGPSSGPTPYALNPVPPVALGLAAADHHRRAARRRNPAVSAHAAVVRPHPLRPRRPQPPRRRPT